ncbi:MAG: hypothetical protein L6R37_002596 [Teloschistes peruensis]|nr:MAG: hypothetical protein L6R37_002596 [Teloschistes peruensis]
MEASMSDERTPKGQTILLNILSPSTEEIPNKLSFSQIPITTTVRTLKERIQSVVPTRPSLPRQRLIYQGKVLASDKASLEDIFGQDAVSTAKNPSVIMATSNVLGSSIPPLTNSPAPALAHQPRMPSFVPQQHGPHINGQSVPQNQQGAMPNIQQGPVQMPSGLNASPFQTGQQLLPDQQAQTSIPPQLQNVLNGHLAAMNQHFAAHFAAQGQQHAHQAPPQHNFQAQPQHWQPSVFPQPSFQQIVAQQQQARAAAGQHGLVRSPSPNDLAREQYGVDTSESQSHQPHQPNANTVVREDQGSNGGTFRMLIQSTSMSRPNSGIGHRPHSQPSLHTPQHAFTPTTPGPFMPPAAGTSTTIGVGRPTVIPRASDHLAIFRQRLSSLEVSIAQGTAPPQAIFDQMRAHLNHIATQPTFGSPELIAQLRTNLINLSLQADRLRASHNSILSQVLANQHTGPAATMINHSQGQGAHSVNGPQPVQHGPTISTPFSHAAPVNTTSIPIGSQFSQNSAQQPQPTGPDLYLLSSPSGPHSLLISPSGIYSTSLPLPLFDNNPCLPLLTNPFTPQQSFAPIQPPFNIQQSQPPPPGQNENQVPGALPFPTNQNQQPPHMQARQHSQQQQHPQQHNQNQPPQQQLQQQNNQARDLLRILLPLGGHLWLLVRLCGFVYFFTAGGGSRRAILLGIAAFVVFIANTGALRPLLRGLWDPVRRQIEGLVPLAAAPGAQDQGQRPENQRQQAGNMGNATEAAAAGDSSTGSNQPNTLPQNPRDQNPSLVRRAERAIALFLASLVPGVGERHIAARDASAAAENRRLEGEREREREREREMEVREGQERENREEVEMERAEVRRQSLAAEGDGVGSGADVAHGEEREAGRESRGLRQRESQGQEQAVEI